MSEGGARWSPQSRDGRWAVLLGGVAVGGTAALAVAFALGMERAEGFFDKPLLTLAGAVLLVSGAACVVVGVLALVRRGDRSRLVVAAVAGGALVVVSSLQQAAEGLGWLSG